MKDIKLSFPYPSTSRHNLSQDISMSLSLGLLYPVRVLEVLGGDSHRIGTSFSLISNPLVKPLLQGVNMRYCRFWVPRRIYHIDQRANNSNYDLMESPVRHATFGSIYIPSQQSNGAVVQYSNFSQSSLCDLLDLANTESNFVMYNSASGLPSRSISVTDYDINYFNAEPYVAYLDICRNYFADSAVNMVCFSWCSSDAPSVSGNFPLVTPLDRLDSYIDGVQNSRGCIYPYNPNNNYSATTSTTFDPFFLPSGSAFVGLTPAPLTSFTALGRHHFGLCVPMNRPDRLSRLFDVTPLTSQNAVISSSEISIANLSVLEKIQRYFTRRFFGGSRFTDIMYSVLGQKVPHVDSPVLLDLFDFELGSELVASTNATETSNPGVLGGFFSSSGRLTTRRGKYKRRYTFNEPGYLIDLVYIMPRLFRTSFYPDYLPVSSGASQARSVPMLQGNFIPDFNGIGWQQPAFVSKFKAFSISNTDTNATLQRLSGFCCEPSWQQYRTLPDVCKGALNPLRSSPSSANSHGFGTIPYSLELNSPLFTFNDRPYPYNLSYGFQMPGGVVDITNLSRFLLSRNMFSDFNYLNSIFGTTPLLNDNMFVVFRYAHQAKRQVTKRFTLNFA